MAGALSKMGAFGLLKLALPLAPQVAAAAAPTLVIWGVVSLLYGAVLALRQEDFKSLVAYSSLSHMGYIVLGIFAFQATALHGALFQILSHGLAVAGLFLFLGLLEERFGDGYCRVGALASSAPRLAILLMLLVLTAVALPLTSGFTSEFLILFGAFQQGMAAWEGGAGSLTLVAVVLAATGMVLGAGYMLRFARALLFGSPEGSPPLADLGVREGLAFVPLLLLIFWIGIAPSSVMTRAEGAVASLRGAMTTAAPTLAATSGGPHVD